MNIVIKMIYKEALTSKKDVANLTEKIVRENIQNIKDWQPLIDRTANVGQRRSRTVHRIDKNRTR
jgi:hypothetical protein